MEDSFSWARRTTGADGRQRLLGAFRTGSRGLEVRDDRVEHVVRHRARRALLTGRDIVDEDRERERVPAVDADVAGERRDLVERAGLRAHAALRLRPAPALRER